MNIWKLYHNKNSIFKKCLIAPELWMNLKALSEFEKFNKSAHSAWCSHMSENIDKKKNLELSYQGLYFFKFKFILNSLLNLNLIFLTTFWILKIFIIFSRLSHTPYPDNLKNFHRTQINCRYSTIDNCDYIPSKLERRHLRNFAIFTEIIFTPSHISHIILSSTSISSDILSGFYFSCCRRNVIKWKFLFISPARRNPMHSLPISSQMMKRKAINLKICLPLTRNSNYFYFYSFPLSHTYAGMSTYQSHTVNYVSWFCTRIKVWFILEF